MRIRLFGTPDNIYTRIIRLILDLKNVGHDFVMAGIFSALGMLPIRRACSPESGC